MADDRDRLLALAKDDPVRFRRLMAELETFVLHPHEGQQLVLDSQARFKVMNCGRRWGKTKLAAHIFTKKARKDNQMLWWVAPTYAIVKRGYDEVVGMIPPGFLAHDPPPSSNFDAGRRVNLRFKNGTKMEFYSAERPEGMLGAGVDYAVLDEAAIMPMRIWNQIVQPTLMDRRGGALMISTPRARNWFYRAWLKGQDASETQWESWTFKSVSNPTLPEGEVEARRKDTPRLEFEQEYEAKFLAAGSSVFVIPDRSVQDGQPLDNGIIDNCPPKGAVVLGVDLARTNDYTVLYAANARTRRNCFFERWHDVTWPEQKRRIRRAVRTLRRNGATDVLIMVDSTGVGDPIYEDLEADGFDVVGINFTTHKNNMVKLLSKDLEERRAFILEPTTEFEDYTMTLTPGGRMTYSAPEGQHDDVVSAKMLQHWGLINEGVPEVQVLSADGPEPPQSDSDPSDELDDEWSDLVDDDGESMTDEEAAVAIGFEDTSRPPTAEELLLRPDVWF